MSNDCEKAAGTCISVIPSEVCLRLVKDADTTFEFILTDGECVPVNITNDSVRLTVKDYPGGTTKITKTNAPGGHVDPDNGKTQFKILKTDISETFDVDQVRWVYEVRRIQAGGDEAVHLKGDFVVDRGVGG